MPPIRFLPQAATAGAGTVKGAIAILLAIPVFRRMLVVAALVIGSHAMSDTFAVIHWRGAGIGRFCDQQAPRRGGRLKRQPRG